MRIVSLLPAATEIVCALGLRRNLVGRSHGCDFPGDVEELPVLTRPRVDPELPDAELDAQVRGLYAAGRPLYELDSARLAELRPDLVVTQAACEVCAVSLDQVRAALAPSVAGTRVLSLQPTRWQHVLGDVQAVADACGVPAAGECLVAELERRLQHLPAPARPAARPRLACVEWLAPPMLAGHWIPDTLVAAGAEALGPPAGGPSPDASWESIAGLQADALIVAPCGFDLGRTRSAAEAWRAALLACAPRVLLMDGNAYFNRPGPRLVDAVEIVAAWLAGTAPHPEQALEL